MDRVLLPLAAVFAALCLVLAGYEHLQAERVRTQLNNLQRDTDEARRMQTEANARELARRALKQSEVVHAQVQATQAADAAADRARADRNRLHDALAAVVAAHATPDPAAPAHCPPANPAAAVLAGLLDRCVERREELARFADRAWIAGEACERSYDALTDR